MSFDPYSVFDLPQSADFETVRAAYRRLARENHPDIAPDKLAATARMAQINRAWAILGDEARRAAFDAELRLQNLEKERREVAEREALRRETVRREAAQREASRAKMRRNATPAPHKAASRPENATRTGPGSRAGKPKTKLSPRQKARENGDKSARSHRQSSDISDASLSPNSPRALRMMRKVTLASRIWHHDGNAGAAIEMCRAVLLADARNVPARELLSEIYASQNRVEVALMMLDQAIQIAPDDRLLRRKRDHLQLAHSSVSAPRRVARRPSLWQRLRARLLKR